MTFVHYMDIRIKTSNVKLTTSICLKHFPKNRIRHLNLRRYISGGVANVGMLMCVYHGSVIDHPTNISLQKFGVTLNIFPSVSLRKY